MQDVVIAFYFVLQEGRKEGGGGVQPPILYQDSLCSFIKCSSIVLCTGTHRFINKIYLTYQKIKNKIKCLSRESIAIWIKAEGLLLNELIIDMQFGKDFSNFLVIQ